jgi:hypothetical protein
MLLPLQKVRADLRNVNFFDFDLFFSLLTNAQGEVVKDSIVNVSACMSMLAYSFELRKVTPCVARQIFITFFYDLLDDFDLGRLVGILLRSFLFIFLLFHYYFSPYLLFYRRNHLDYLLLLLPCLKTSTVKG